MEDVLDRVFRIKDPGFQGVLPDPALLEAAMKKRGSSNEH